MSTRVPLSSPIRIAIMRVLSEVDDPLRMDEIAVRVNSPKRTVSGITDRALRCGWVARSLPPGLLRTYQYTITDKGREWLAAQEGE